MNRHTKTWITIGLLIAVLCPGCAQRKAIVKDTFLLDAKRPGASVQSSSETILAVQPFSIAPAFQGKGLVYRKGENQYESDYYNEYFVSPHAMMSDQTRNWLAESGALAQVLSPVSSVEPTHILEGHIKQIAIDYRDETNPQAVLEMTFFLLELHRHDRAIRFHKTYSATLSLETKTASSGFDALSQCLEKILENLEKDLMSSLSEK